jgi:signal transduction histidine kinase
MDRRGWKGTATYVGLLSAAFVVAVLGSWAFGSQLDNSVYDEMFRRFRPKPWTTHSALLVIDERSLGAIPNGREGIRVPLAKALRLVASAKPLAVAVDVILADRRDPAVDAELASALRATPNLVLSSQLLQDGFEDPLPEFRQSAAAIGHVHGTVALTSAAPWRSQAQPDKDAVTRAIPLEKQNPATHRRLWALSLEAFRLTRNAPIVESPSDLEVGGVTIPAGGDARPMRVRFVPPYMAIPRVTLANLLANPGEAAKFTGKVVFVGVTAQTEHDRLFTPYSEGVPTSGIEINADAFETIAQGLFLTDVPDYLAVLMAAAFVAAAGLAFRYLPGWPAYAVGVLIVAAASMLPYAFLSHQHVMSFSLSASAAWFGTLTAAAYYHLVVRRNLRRSEAERARYQQAMHFVTHEMRTPLSAIQGSSELISRYALTEEKRKQLSQLINSESKRLARMVEIFLNVERLSAGQMELKRETISVKQMVEICAERTKPLADRKHIGMTIDPVAEDLQLTGDRELMEYACYNLLTNAVKYSPQRTEVRVSSVRDSGHVRIAVKDQGIGMDQKEVKQIFRKFYRTKKAEESGEAGTGIGLSIVQQIVEQHGGDITVTSQPGVGSCFTLILPAAVAVPIAAERH